MTITLFYASILGIIMAFLSIRVPLRRKELEAPWGDADDNVLISRIRTFGNFIEYVPFLVLMMAMIEFHGAPSLFLHWIGGVLVVLRILHVVSLKKGDNSNWRFFLRFLSAFGTWLILVIIVFYALYETAREIV